MDGVQLSWGYRATTTKQFTFCHIVPRSSWYSVDQPQKDARLNQPWRHPVLLNLGPLDLESRALTTRPLLHKRYQPNGNSCSNLNFCYYKCCLFCNAVDSIFGRGVTLTDYQMFKLEFKHKYTMKEHQWYLDFP